MPNKGDAIAADPLTSAIEDAARRVYGEAIAALAPRTRTHVLDGSHALQPSAQTSGYLKNVPGVLTTSTATSFAVPRPTMMAAAEISAPIVRTMSALISANASE